MNKRNFVLSTVPLFKSANNRRRHTSHIRSTEVTDGAVFTLAYETRYYCSFIGNRFPVYRISLSLSTIVNCFILDRTDGQSCERMDRSWVRVLNSVPEAEGGVWENTRMRARSGCDDTYSRSRRLSLSVLQNCIAPPPCAELAVRSSMCAVDRKPCHLSCHYDTTQDFFFMNRHRVISN